MAIESLGLFGYPLFTNIILPFLLVFTVVFAILEKSQILGKDKKQINAIVSFVFGLTAIGLPQVLGVVATVIPIISVIIVIVLSFMLVLGLIGGTTEKGHLSRGLQITVGIISGMAIIATVLWTTGAFEMIKSQPWFGTALSTFIILAFIIAVISIVTSGKSEGAK